MVRGKCFVNSGNSHLAQSTAHGNPKHKRVGDNIPLARASGFRGHAAQHGAGLRITRPSQLVRRLFPFMSRSTNNRGRICESPHEFRATTNDSWIIFLPPIFLPSLFKRASGQKHVGQKNVSVPGGDTREGLTQQCNLVSRLDGARRRPDRGRSLASATQTGLIPLTTCTNS
jgi:hypothetical protein